MADRPGKITAKTIIKGASRASTKFQKGLTAAFTGDHTKKKTIPPYLVARANPKKKGLLYLRKGKRENKTPYFCYLGERSLYCYLTETVKFLFFLSVELCRDSEIINNFI